MALNILKTLKDNKTIITIGAIIAFFVVLGLTLGLVGYFGDKPEPRTCNVTQHYTSFIFERECETASEEGCVSYKTVSYFIGSILLQTTFNEKGLVFVAKERGGNTADPSSAAAENIFASTRVTYIMNNTYPLGVEFTCFYYRGSLGVTSNNNAFEGLMIAGFVIMAVSFTIFVSFIIYILF